MPRVYLPLLPLPALAVAVVLSACSKAPGEQTTRVIPPAVAYAASNVPPPPPPSAPPQVAPAGEEAPTEHELKEFERGVGK